MLVWRTWDRRPCTFVGFGSLIEVYATDLGRAIKKHGVSARQRGARNDSMTRIAIACPPLSETDHSVQLRRAVIASTVGTTIEWYDFLLYGQMAAIVFPSFIFRRPTP